MNALVDASAHAAIPRIATRGGAMPVRGARL
jgi:hypothetical protein